MSSLSASCLAFFPLRIVCSLLPIRQCLSVSGGMLGLRRREVSGRDQTFAQKGPQKIAGVSIAAPRPSPKF